MSRFSSVVLPPSTCRCRVTVRSWWRIRSGLLGRFLLRLTPLLTVCGVAVTGAALTATTAGAAAQALPPGAPDGIGTSITDHTLLVTAGHQSTMRLAPTPGTGSGPMIICGWFWLDTSTVDVGILQEPDPEIGSTYLLWCWYAHDLVSLPGHPVVTEYTGPGIPGDPADIDDVSEFALASIDFSAPELALNPFPTHVVGIESWLAVTSRLDHGAIHANAGPVWVSVRPEFRDVIWDLGNGDTVRCTRATDATTTWDPTGSRPRTSACVYAYESAGHGDGRHDISATVTWTILRRTFQQDAWGPWRDFGLTTTETIRVTDLQAVID